MELNNEYSEGEVEDMLNLFIACKILKKVEITASESLEAQRLSKERNLPFMDCLNAIQARNHDAILITRDKHYFSDLKDIVSSLRPEDI